MKHKTFKISILTLALTLLMALSAFFTINFMPAKASGTVTVNGTNVFTSTGDAEVIAHRQGDGEDAKYYTMFTLPTAKTRCLTEGILHTTGLNRKRAATVKTEAKQRP